MKNYIVFIIMLLGLAHTYAQNVVDIRLIQDRISKRDSIMEHVKKNVLLDSLRNQIADYQQVGQMLHDQIDQYACENDRMRKQIEKFELLTSSDTIVFSHDLKAIQDIPDCLKARVDLICSIVDLRTKINIVEATEKRLEEQLNNTPAASIAIKETIEKDLTDISELIDKIDERGLFSLSTEQQQYFRPHLTERYNRFIIKYFE